MVSLNPSCCVDLGHKFRAEVLLTRTINQLSICSNLSFLIAAKELGYEQYFKPDMRSYPITDDHYPLLKAGLRVVDVIDLDYDAHHTLADDIGRVSAKSLKIVGDVAMALLR